MRWRQGLSVSVLIVFLTCFSAAALADVEAVAPADRVPTGRFLVHLKVATSPEGALSHADAVAGQRRAIGLAKEAVRKALAGRSHRVAREYRSIPFMAVEGGSDVLAALAPMASTIYADHLLRPSLPESIPLIGANQAWTQGFEGSGSVVAVLDTGVDTLHPFLTGKVTSEACYTGNGSCPNGLDVQLEPGAGVPCTFAPGVCRHGTLVAGIAAGAGATFSGVAKGAQIMPIQVFSKFTGTECNGGENPCALAYTSDLIAAMEHVYELRDLYHIAAVNMSLGGDVYTSASECDADNAPTKAIIDTLRSVGIATVIAAGNNGAPNGISAPGCISSAIGVGSTTKAGAVSAFSNSASFLSLLAPGSSILSSVPDGGFTSFSGTSMAAPHVAGAWAVIKQKNPQASVAAVLDALVATGVPLSDPKNGIVKPRIDLAGAVALVAGQAASRFTLSMSKIGQGLVTSAPSGVTCGVDCSESYPRDTVVMLSATPDTGFTFTGWSGDPDCAGGSVRMTTDKVCTASFRQVTAPTGSPQALSSSAALPSIVLEQVAPGLAFPVSIAHAGDGSGRLFIVLQEGKIVIYDGTQILPTAFLDLTSLVSCCGERGLLGLAFHPNYLSNGFFYVNYTNTAGNTVIARYKVSANANIADFNSVLPVLTIAQPYANHKGGQLQFGPDGYLYIGMGDGGSGGDPENRAQNLGELLGKMLRIDVNAGSPYTVPSSNPFIGTAGAKPEIWALGLRNPWRFSFDRLTGDLFIADVGQNAREEVDFQPATSAGGENYGWRKMEGTACFNPSSGCNDGTLTLPILEYTHASGDCTVIGGYRYRGTQVSGLGGAYIYGDFCTGQIWGATPSGAVWSSVPLLDLPFLLSTFGEDQGGELYLTEYSATGSVYRIKSATQPALTVNGSSTPITVAPGSPITVVAANLAANDSNIVALFATGTANSQSLNWVYLTGNQTTRSGNLTGVTTSFVLPTTGTFEVRALHWVTGVGYVTDAISPTVTAQSAAGGGTLTVNGSSMPITVTPGSPITVVAANLAANDSNIVALFATGTANSQSLNWVYLTGNQTTRSGNLTGVTTSFVLPTTGTFEVRALHWVTGVGYVTDAISPTVTAQSAAGGGTLTVNGSSTPITVSAGSSITVVAANLAANDSNIVALFATGTANSQSLNWVYLTGNQTTRSGNLTGVTTSFVLPTTGTFEVRALHWVTGVGYVTDATSPRVTVQ